MSKEYQQPDPFYEFLAQRDKQEKETLKKLREVYLNDLARDSVRIIILTGPPGSGKNTLADALLQSSDSCNVHIKEYSDVLYAALNCLFGNDMIDCSQMKASKDAPFNKIFDYVPREELIALSEHFTKYRYGQMHFGLVMAKRIIESMTDWHEDKSMTIMPGGFEKETEALAKIFGAENICTIQLIRDNCDFLFDSRGYLSEDFLLNLGIMNRYIYNIEGDITHALRKVIAFLRQEGFAF